MTYQQISPEKRTQIVEALKNGETKEAIRHRLRTGWKTVKRIAQEEGFDPPEVAKPKLSAHERIEMAAVEDEIENGLSEGGETWVEMRIVVDDEERAMVRTKLLTTEAAMLLIQRVVASGLTR